MATVGGIEFYINAQTAEYLRKMATANKQMQTLGTTAAAVSKKSVAATTAMTTGFTRFEKVLKRVRTVMASVTVSLLTIAGFAALAKLLTAAVEFETAFAGVQKTVEATTEQLAGLRDEIRQMAKEIPLTTTELSKIGEVGGQLGISVQNMGRFIDIIAKLGVATTMSIEDAAMSVARFAAIMNTSEKDYERLASTLVHLGNNFAATEQEIMTMALRIAGAGRQIGMTEDEVLSFATALTAVGIRAEAGGTAISRVMIEIDKQVAKAGEKLRIFADVAGMSIESFTRLWQTDATAALVKFIEGLKRVEDEGGNASIVLEELGLGAVRVSDTLRRASASTELLNKALEYGATGWRENIALTREAEIRFATMASQFKMLLSRIADIAITIGTQLVPWFLVLIKNLVTVAEYTRAWALVLKVVGTVYLGKLLVYLVNYTRALGANAAANIIAANTTHTFALAGRAAWSSMVAQGHAAMASAAATTTATLAQRAYVVSTTSATIATAGFRKAVAVTVATLKAFAPVAAVLAGFEILGFLKEFIPALKENVTGLNELGKAANFNIKLYQDRLDALGISYETTNTAQTNAWTGIRTWGQNLLATVGIMDSTTEGTVRYEQHLKDLLLQFTNLDLIMVTGKGTWDDYYSIVAQAPDQLKTVNLLVGELIKDYAHFTATGGKHNVWVGDNIEHLRNLIGVMHIFGDESDPFVQVLQKMINGFDESAYAADKAASAYDSLNEAQKKIINAFTDVQKPLSAYVKKWEEIAAVNKAAKTDFVTMAEYARQFSAQIIEAAEAQTALGKPLGENELKLYKLAKSFESVNSEAQGYVKSIKSAINPSIEMGKRIRACR
jgi:TP901 family phage tail tape measure protein